MRRKKAPPQTPAVTEEKPATITPLEALKPPAAVSVEPEDSGDESEEGYTIAPEELTPYPADLLPPPPPPTFTPTAIPGSAPTPPGLPPPPVYGFEVEAPKRRGRKPGFSPAKKTPPALPASIDLRSIMEVMDSVGAAIVGADTPEARLTVSERQLIGEALQNFSESSPATAAKIKNSITPVLLIAGMATWLIRIFGIRAERLKTARAESAKVAERLTPDGGVAPKPVPPPSAPVAQTLGENDGLLGGGFKSIL